MVENGLKHTGEHTYEWVHSPDDTSIAVFPGWLLQELQKRPERPTGGDDLDWAKALSGVAEGERDNRVWTMA